MRGDYSSMRVLRPRGAAEALAFYKDAPGSLPLAGGTDLMVSWNAGLGNGKTVIDLSRVREWMEIRELPGVLSIGSLVTHSRIRESPLVRREFPLLARSCAVIGAVQIQNRGTLGGNVANASPAADTFPPLAVYEAVVTVVSLAGRRSIPIMDIFTGPKKTALRNGELIESVDIPFLEKRPGRGFFRKVGTRAAQAISKVVGAGLLWLGPDGGVESLRLALGSVAPTVKRLRHVESYLAGRRLAENDVAQALRLVERDIAPIDDIRSTKNYRLAVSKNLLRSFLRGTP